MSEWIVYSKDGLKERCRLKSVEYNGSYMNERVVTATFKHFEEVAFEVFDYIEYRCERFEIEAIPTVKKTSSHDYEYDLRFVSLKYELERCEMRDIVPDDNRVVYPTPLTFSFTGTVRYLAERIQANLDALYGEGVWSITLEDGIDSEEKNITISQQNCWNALSLVNTTYNLNFQVKGRNIVIGNSNSSVGYTFKYGKGNGLYEIERTSDSDTGIVTKLRAYGSDRNLDYSYPKRPEWNDSVLDTSFILSPLRLMLPSFKADGKTDYILADEAVIAKYGIREASVIYDDIYPSITGAVVAGNAIDEIKGVEPITDDNASTFVIYLHNLGFDLESHLTTSDAQISMKSGAMQGYTFNMSNIEKQSDGSYKITLGRITTDTNDTGNYSIPNKDWNMKAGDKFVLLNILMPQEYIRNAEERLLERAEEYLAEYGKTNFGYSVGIHDKFLKEHSDIYDQLIEGSKLSVYDEEIGINEEVTIQSLTITENSESNILPQVKVTLNNKPSASTLERIQGQIKELSDSASGNFSSQSELLSQYRKKLDKPFFDRLFAAVDEKGNEIPSTDLTTPIFYIKSRYNFASLGGITTYLNDGSFDLPSIYAGIPFDNRTIWLNPETKLVEVIGGTGGGEGGVSNFWDLTNIPTWITATKPEYSYDEIIETPDLSEYAKLSDIPSLEGYAKLTDVDSRINDLVNGAPQAYDTLKEIADVLQGNVNSIGDIITTLGTKADKTELDKYLPLKGGTINGNLIVEGNISIDSKKTIKIQGGYSILGLTDNVYFVGATNHPTNIKSDGTLTHNDATIWDSNTLTSLSQLTNDADFTTNAYVNETFVTLKGDPQTIESEKDFIGGLKVNGSPIVYDSEKGYWKLQGNLLITGGLTQYVDDGSVDLPNLYDGLPIDGSTIYWDNGVLKAKVAEGGITSITKDMVVEALGFTPYDATNPNGYATQTWVNQQGFLTEHQDLSGYQTKITSTNKLAYSLISGTPDLSVYLTTSSASSTYQPKITSSAKLAASLVSGLATVATSGSYNDLSNKPTIPTNTNQLTNGAGFITSSGYSSGVLDYNNTSKYIKIGYTGTGLTSTTADFLAAYGLNSAGERVIKDISKAEVQKWLGLGSNAYNSTAYLPLAGGTLSTSERVVLNLKSSHIFGTVLGFQKSDGTLISNIGHIPNSAAPAHGAFWTNNEANIGFILGSDGIAYITTNSNNLDPKYNLWHSGNSNLSSVDWNASKLILNTTNTTDWNVARANNTIQLLRTGATAGNAPLTYCSGISIMTSYTGFQLASYGGDWNNLYFRSIQDNDTWLPWRTVAFLDSNVASATKLKTARTIWGQSFDGTGDVVGDFICQYLRIERFNEINSYTDYANKVSASLHLQYRTNGNATLCYGGGNVGIGTDNPQYKLEVNGDIKFGSKLVWADATNYYIGARSNNAFDYVNWYGHYFKSQGADRMCITREGLVGIGTTSPLSKLHVAGAATIGIESSTTPYSSINFRNTDTELWQISARFNKNVSANNDVMNFYYYNGSTWKVTMALYTTGNLLVAGGLTQYSDIRKKTKLNDVELTLKQVANAPLIEHYYNSDDKKTTHVGSIAQYWADMNDWFCKLDSDGFYTMEIQNAALASAISVARELERYESKTDKKIRMLRKRINELEDEIEILKKGA